MLVSLLQNRSLFQAICPGSLWARDNRWLLSRVQRLAGPAGGTGAFCPGWRHQPGQMGGLLSLLVDPTGTKGPPFVPVGVSNRDKTHWPPYPLPSPPPEPFNSFVLGSGEGSFCSFLHHICEKIFDSPVHPSALKVWGLFFLLPWLV